MSKLQVVDPHFHLWDTASGNYPWLETPSTGFSGDNTLIARSYLIDEFLAEASAVELLKAVFVEAIATDPLAETAYNQEVADGPGKGLPHGIVAYCDLSAPDAAQQLEALAAHANLRGIRQILNVHDNSFFTYVKRQFMHEPAWQQGFRLLRRHNLSFDLQLYPKQMPAAAALAAANPETPIILNHAGMWVDRTLTGWREWRDGMRLLAAHDNVHVKISGLGMLDHQWKAGSIRPLVLETLDAFGPGRAMFASNFPVDKLYSDYGAIWNAFADIVADLSGPEKAALFRGNAERVYRI